MTGGGGGEPSREPPHPLRPLGPEAGGWLRRLTPFWLAHWRSLSLALAASVVSMGALSATPLLQRLAINDAILTHRRAIGPLLIAMGALFGVRFGSGLLRRYRGGRVAWDINYDLRNAVFDHLQRLDFAGHDQLQTGQLVSRTNSDLNLLRGLLSQLPLMVGNLLQFLMALTIMLVLSPLLTAVVAPVAPVLFLLALRMRRVVYPSSWEAQNRMAEMVSVVDDAVSGVRVVKGFGQEERETGQLLSCLDRLFGARVRNLRIRSKRAAALQTVPALAQVGVLCIGGWLVMHHELSVGTLVAFFSYLTQLAAPARMMANMLVQAQNARAGAERILEVLDSLPDVRERPDAEALAPSEGRVSFSGVRFGYLRSEPVLDGFDLEVEAGERVALVGTSGSGKSTVALLCPRFYDVHGGAVRIDGVDVRDVTFDSLRRQIGVVFEES
ncbi:MAG: ABC transporter ATP-binding protein, partial [Acidimicrobiales bacterium]